MCFVTRGINFKAIWFRREGQVYLLGVIRQKTKPRGEAVAPVGRQVLINSIHHPWPLPVLGLNPFGSCLTGVTSTGCAEAPACHCPLSHVY